MAKKRTLILLKGPAEGGAGGGRESESGGMTPLGTLSELRAALGQWNVSSDGSGPMGMGERVGVGVLFGPGMVMEVPLSGAEANPDIAQVLVSVTDEDFAWPVLLRICRANTWKLMDPDSGRTFP